MKRYYDRDEDRRAKEIIDLLVLREKGLSEEKISNISMLPKELIVSYFNQVDQFRQQSGVF